MFKKKPIYIILLILSTLLLIADLGFYALTQKAAQFADFPDNTTVSADFSHSGKGDWSAVEGEDGTESTESDAHAGHHMRDDSDSGETTDNADASGDTPDMSQMPSDGSTPDMSQMPSDGSMPDMSQMPSDGSMPDMSQFPGSTDSSAAEEMQQAAETVSSISKVRKICIPLAIVFLLLDVFAVFRLVTISRKKKQEQEEAEKAALTELTEEEAEALQAKRYLEETIAKRNRTSRRNRILVIVLIVALLIFAIFTRFTAAKNAAANTDIEEKRMEVTVEKGSIDTTLSGYGTLEEAESTSVTIPGAVSVVSYAVKNGDTVEEGDLIALVDKTTVLSSIAELQTLMDELDEELEELSDETVDDEITAAADGRVIVVYAEEDASVVDTMYENGALLLISLDGLMAVDFESEEDFTVGESVTVTTEDGEEYSGRVAAIQLDQITVTLTDDGPLPDQQVTVSDSKGNTLGEGSLYIHSMQKVTGFTGTVDAVKVEAGDEIEAGDTLLTLKDTDYAANYDTLILERETLEDQMSQLMKAYMTEGIYASEKGIISGISEDAVIDKGDTSEDSAAATTTTTHTVEAPDTQADDSTADEESESKSSDSDESSSDAGSSEESSSDASDSTESDSEDKDSEDSDSEEGDSEEEDSESTEDSGNDDSEEEDSESGSSGSESGSDPSEDSDTSESEETLLTTQELAAWILSLDNATLNQFLSTLDYDTLKILYDAMRSFETGSSADESGQSSGTATGGNQFPSGSDFSGSGSSSFSTADLQKMLAGATGGKTSGMNFSGMFSSAAASALLSSSSTDSDEEDDELASFIFDETELCTLTPDDSMTIEITVDELDILSVLVNTQVEVTLDAFSGQSFEGRITYIDVVGSNAGGNTKYTVEVSIDRQENMLSGMNANVKIVLDTKEDILVIPEAALSEENGSVYVYTGYDEKKDSLTDPVEVETGLSDGTSVEITGGLEEGAAIYYMYADTITYNFTTAD